MLVELVGAHGRTCGALVDVARPGHDPTGEIIGYQAENKNMGHVTGAQVLLKQETKLFLQTGQVLKGFNQVPPF